MYLQTVALNGVKCFAYHGFYTEEQLTGGYFVVDTEVTFNPSNDTENLENTVNYEILNDIINCRMQQTQKLLETVVKNMMDDILQKYPFVDTANVSIKKLSPPMRGEIAHSYVALAYKKPSL